MSKGPQAEWLCGLCSKEVVPYGKSCPDKMTCRHWLDGDLNANGHWYKKQEALKAGRGIGIAQISDEEENDGR